MQELRGLARGRWICGDCIPSSLPINALNRRSAVIHKPRMPAPPRLVFLGSDPIALPLLNWLSGPGSGIARIAGVFTQPDRATGRGQKVRPNAIKDWAQEHALPVFQPDELTETVRSQLATLDADLGLVMAYGHILKDDFIRTPRLGMLNLHTSILPGYRGASPIQTAVANGEAETGVSLMRIVRRLDAGPVADIERVPIRPLDTSLEVEKRLAEAVVPLVARALPRLAAGTLEFSEQEEGAATHCRKLTREDSALDFSAPAAVLAARINGLFPWPASFATISGQSVKFGLADAEAGARGACGPAGVVLPPDAEALRIATGQGVLRVRRMQRPGGKMLAAAEFLRGFPVPPGTQLISRAMPALLR